MKKLFFAVLAISAMMMTACKPSEEPEKTQTKKVTAHCAIANDIDKYFDLDIKCTIDGQAVDTKGLFTSLEKVTDEAILLRAGDDKDRMFEYNGELEVELAPGVSSKKIKMVVTFHRNKNVVLEKEYLMAYALFARTGEEAVFGEEIFSLKHFNCETEEDAAASLDTFDGTVIETEWVVKR